MGLLYERRSQKSRLGSRHPAIFILQLFWVITILWCQFGAFFYSLAHCRWPDKVLELQVGTVACFIHALVCLTFAVEAGQCDETHPRVTDRRCSSSKSCHAEVMVARRRPYYEVSTQELERHFPSSSRRRHLSWGHTRLWTVCYDQRRVCFTFHVSVHLRQYLFPLGIRYDAYYRRFTSIFRRSDEMAFYFIPGNTDVGYDCFVSGTCSS